MNTFRIGAGMAALAFSLAVQAPAFAAIPAGPHILIIDRQGIVTGSKLGENIRQQIMGYEEKAQNELGAEGQALQNEQQALQSANMPADAKAKKTQALQAKQAAFRSKVQERQSLIQGGQMAAQKFYSAAVDGIVHDIRTERGADVVLEKSAVADIASGLDITKDVIQRLDKKISGYKVPLVKAPLNDMLQMMQQQRQQQ